jgi:hypothetical protein
MSPQHHRLTASPPAQSPRLVWRWRRTTRVPRPRRWRRWTRHRPPPPPAPPPPAPPPPPPPPRFRIGPRLSQPNYLWQQGHFRKSRTKVRTRTLKLSNLKSSLRINELVGKVNLGGVGALLSSKFGFGFHRRKGWNKNQAKNLQ